jgi:hypothetical protein
MDKLNYKIKLMMFQAELDSNITNRRRKAIQNELAKIGQELRVMQNEELKIEAKNKSAQRDEKEVLISKLKLEVEYLSGQIAVHKKQIELNNGQKKMYQVTARKVFQSLNAKLTPDEISKFKTGIEFIRLFVD